MFKSSLVEKKENESFRDAIATVNKEGKRTWLFPKKPSGKLYQARKIVSYCLLLILFISPFIKINGNQFMLFNVLERRFNVFGFPFWPQDFYLVVIAMLIGVVFIALFTVSFGRVFCGWVCPQTIFMELVFRRIEYWIDGDRNKQRKLYNQPWNAEKIRKRLLKWSIFLFISFLIANVFLAYLIGSDTLLQYIGSNPATSISTLLPLLIFTLVFFFVFAWFREQVCVIACPYGRLQGVLLDTKSIVVAYDYVRGEAKNGRKKFRKTEDRKALGVGDCIDCMQCVHVCPTGIDIRNGTQLECVNCTACIDECNHIMERINLPKGLIRYASEEEIANNTPFTFNTRMKGYAAVLFILVGVLLGLLLLRNDVEAKILRLPGQLYEHKGPTKISNVFTYKLINKTTEPIEHVVFSLRNYEGEIKMVSTNQILVPEKGIAEGTLFIEIEKENLNSDKNKLIIDVYSGSKLIETTSVNFLGPRSYR